MDKLKQYLFNLWVAVDQLVNTILGGDPDMTVSGRAGRAVAEGRCVACKGLCWLLNFVQKDHCERANRAEKDEGKDEVWGA